MKHGIQFQKMSDFPPAEGVRAGLRAQDIKQAFLDNLFYGMGRVPAAATLHDAYSALALTVRDRLLRRSVETAESAAEKGARVLCYFSAEFLPGPHLANNLLSLGATDATRSAMTELGLDLDQLIEEEEEPGLGNGGLGRLASCYMDSLASVQVPAIGYGIRYEFGIFDQAIQNGCQVETTDKWLRFGNPWEIGRPELAYEVKFGGRTECWKDEQGRYRVRWLPDEVVKGMAYDTPILGYRVGTCNTLRLWKAEAVESFDFSAFNQGNYMSAVNAKMQSENITKVLYPNDEPAQGKRLRLQQQFFFVSCSLQDMLRMHQSFGGRPDNFHERFAVQLNDTHPAIAVAELMRLLVDEHVMPWDQAWSIVCKTFAYTNHTLLPEALECWPLALFKLVLPRHLEIIYEISARFLDEVRIRFYGDEARIARLSLIDEQGERYVRMAHLACVGSHTINGVAELHSELLKQDVLKDFYALWPERFTNKTNGVTPRRWMALSNPRLTTLITDAIGESWIKNLDELRRLEPFADDAAFRARWRATKHANKAELATFVKERTGIAIDPESLFDVQVKRIHEYKRQHLNILHIIALYHRLRSDSRLDIQPRTFIFGGKAAPAYHAAKLIIKLINAVGDVVNRDPAVKDRLKIVFLPNFNVTNGQRVYPAAELSEQISTAGKEASGTGNMKFSMNGALTIGTMDGANIEIREQVGAENFFLFGLTAEQVAEVKARGYRPQDYMTDELAEVIELVGSGFFSRGDAQMFRSLLDGLLWHDPYLVFADFASYSDCQEHVSDTYRDVDRSTRMSLLNAARSGKFSSDRTIQEYCTQSWKAPPVPIRMLSQEDVKVGFMQ